jgi:single-strand DNA-binding protein
MDYTTLTGLVATSPRFIRTQDGLDILSFRLATSPTENQTNWYTITAFGQTAQNASASIEKGHRVIVSGSLRIRDWDNGERTGTSVEVEVDSIGHDLVYGTSEFTRYNQAPKPEPHNCDCNNCDKRES